MASGTINIGWNKYEAALLIDTYQRYIEGEWSRKEAVCVLSNRLRARMLKLGNSISESYRNENGIALQMSAIDYLFTNGQTGIGHISNIFREVTQIYNDSRAEYEEILKIANMMYPVVELSIFQEKETIHTVVDAVQEDAYDPMLLSKIHAVLGRRFPKGYRLKSFVEFKRFLAIYEEEYNEKFTLGEAEADEYVSRCGIEHEGRVYLSEQMLPEEIRLQLNNYVQKCFEEGINCIYYTVLYDKFHLSFLDHHILNAQMLRKYLEHNNERGWHFWTEYLTEKDYEEVNILNEVLRYVREQGGVVKKDDVVKALPHLPKEQVEQAFDQKPQILISCGRNLRFHSANFVVDVEDMKQIASIIENGLSSYGFISFAELMDEMRTKMPGFIADNEAFTEIGIRKVLAYVLGDLFCFNSNFISKKGEPYTTEDAFMAMAKREHFSADDVDSLAKECGTLPNYWIESMLRHSIRVSSTEYVCRDLVHFDVEAIDEVLMRYCQKDFIPLLAVDSFAAFPDCGYPWNPFLLESYILDHSQQFVLVHSRYLGKNQAQGAIVKRSANIPDFAALLILALAEADITLNKVEVLDFLLENGYIAQRRYEDIDNIINKAKQIRAKHESI